MNIKIKMIKALLYFIFIGIIALLLLYVQDAPKEYEEPSTIQTMEKPRIPTKEDLEDLNQDFVELLNYLEENEIGKDEITESYTKVTEAIVCSIANRNFNTLAEQYEEYMKRASEIHIHIEETEKRYNQYLSLLDNIPTFSKALREEKYTEFQEIIEPLYDRVCDEKQKYLSDKEDVESMYQSAKKIADDFFEEYYELMCHITNAEAGTLKCTSMERCYVMNVIENRIKSPVYKQNTLYDVIYAPGQYAPVMNGSINKTPYSWVREDVENYLRGRVETGMPDNVLYQALFEQGHGIWKKMPSGHYFCYH